MSVCYINGINAVTLTALFSPQDHSNLFHIKCVTTVEALLFLAN